MSEKWRTNIIEALKRMLLHLENGGAMPLAYSHNDDDDDCSRMHVGDAASDFGEATPSWGNAWGVCVPVQRLELRDGAEDDGESDSYVVMTAEESKQLAMPLDGGAGAP